MITKEAIEAAARAMCEAWHYSKIGTPDGDAEWARKQDQYRTQARAALTAAFAAMPGPAVKALEWVPIIADGRDIEAVTEFGKYTISVDSSFAGGTHYLWTPDQCEYDDDHHSEHRGMTSARAAAQSDYEARIMAAIEPQAQVRCRDCDGYNCDDGCAYPDTARVETSTDLASENERLREALTPSGNTKAAYIGEFKFKVDDRDEDGEECSREVAVPWTTIKEIMSAIREHAALERRT